VSLFTPFSLAALFPLVAYAFWRIYAASGQADVTRLTSALKRLPSGWWLLPAGLLLLWLYLPVALNGSDDGPGYLAFAVKYSEEGRLIEEPFSVRRLLTLGAHIPLQSFVISTASVRYLSIAEPVLALCLITLLVREYCRQEGVPSGWSAIISGLIALTNAMGSLYVANLTPSYLMGALLLFLLAPPEFDKRAWNALWAGVLYGVVGGIAIGIKVTMLPPIALVVLIHLVALWLHPDTARPQIAGGLLAGFVLGLLVSMLPMMIQLYESSGTLLFPLLGQGTHTPMPPGISVVAGRVASLPPILLATLAKDPAALALLVVAGILLVGGRRARLAQSREFGYLVIWVSMYLLMIYAGEGVADTRYVFPITVAVLAWLCSRRAVYEAAIRFRSSESKALPISSGLLAIVVCAGTLAYGPRLFAIFTEKMKTRMAALIAAPREARSYVQAQSGTERGSKILVFALRAYLLDYGRNKVLICDQAGAAGPAPGWPRVAGGMSLNRYLADQGIDYLLVSRSFTVAPSKNEGPAQGWNQYLAHQVHRVAQSLQDPMFQDAIVFSDHNLIMYRIRR
jgi:hypothetical protein